MNELINAQPTEVPKKKRGRPVGWRGTYKKRVKSNEESSPVPIAA